MSTLDFGEPPETQDESTPIDVALNVNGMATAREMDALLKSTKRTYARIFDWIEPAPEEYPGFKIYMWMNHPQSLVQEVQSGWAARVYPALMKAIKEHNGLTIEVEEDVMEPVLDAEGTPIIDPTSGKPSVQPKLDEDGNRITVVSMKDAPPASAGRAFYDFIPQELCNAIIYVLATWSQRLPNSTRALKPN